MTQDKLQRGVAVVGGGTAGYLAALTLRALNKDLSITLIESSKVPIIGVGESTTSEIVPFLHSLLGFEPVEFYKKVKPTWKLGIKFLWGPEDFFYPFDRGPLVEAHAYEGNAQKATLNSTLMSKDQGLISNSQGHLSAIETPFAYHLDNKRFVSFLREKALERNINYIDEKVIDASIGEDGESIGELLCEGGRKLVFDFYIDCTGFSSLLIGKMLGSRFNSYKDSLFTDSAIVGEAPNCGFVKPYTTAETMQNGWCWNIPQETEDHLGYVFASAFCSTDQAEEELRRKHPGVGKVRLVKFRTGRHDEFIKGNVAAIGNSYGFVEPLESTGIFVICREALLIAQNLGALTTSIELKQSLSTSVAKLWEYIRWFLSVHYRFNTRVRSKFWDACRNQADITGAQAIVEAFQKTSSALRAGVVQGPGGGHNFDGFGYDVLLLGQRIDVKVSEPKLNLYEYQMHMRKLRSLSTGAMNSNNALKALVGQPRVLNDLCLQAEWIKNTEKVMLAGYAL